MANVQKFRLPLILFVAIASANSPETIMTIVQHFRLPLILFAAIGSALSAGIFFAFSTFVMQALGQQPNASGIATMQAINITVINPWFMVAFFGPGLACLILTVFALRQWEQPGSIYWLVGS